MVLPLLENQSYDDVQEQLEEIKETETIKSVELVFKDGTTLDDYQELLAKQCTEKLFLQRIFLNE